MEKLENIQTKDRIAAILRNEILSGRILDNEELAQEQLAEKLAVSRMPVREAMLILEQEGFLQRLPNRHVRVVGLQKRNIHESMRMIAAVETELILVLMHKGVDVAATANPADDLQFHTGFSDLTENHYIRQIHKKLLESYPRYIWGHCAKQANLEVQNEAIRAAIDLKDEVAVRKAVYDYYDSMADLLLTHTKGDTVHEQPTAD